MLFAEGFFRRFSHCSTDPPPSASVAVGVGHNPADLKTALFSGDVCVSDARVLSSAQGVGNEGNTPVDLARRPPFPVASLSLDMGVGYSSSYIWPESL
jgi:hypothetical protein